MTHDGSTPIRPVADDAARGMPRLPWWAASLTLETGLLHMIAGSDHVRARWGYGVFFLVVALCQIIGGTALLVKSSRGLYLTGIVGMRHGTVVYGHPCHARLVCFTNGRATS